MTRILRFTLAAGLITAILLPSTAHAQRYDRAKVQGALKAATKDIAKNATVMDWDQTVLREGTNGWTCMPTPPNLPGDAPMCLDEQWMNWAHAWQTKTKPSFTGVGIAYMLEGDAGASNSDPYGTRENSTDWVEAGPHLMIIVPDPSMLDGMTTDHTTGGPWVMWQGTPYAHIMVPVR